MTRFARASGSKSSNQRTPDESTPWQELKKQIKGGASDSNAPENNEEETNWKEVINNEKEVEKNLNSVWCDFSDGEEKKPPNSKKKKNNDNIKDFPRKGRKGLKRRKADSMVVDDEDPKIFKKGRKNDSSDFEVPRQDSDDNTSHKPDILNSEHESKLGVSSPSDWAEGFEWKDSGNAGQGSKNAGSSLQKTYDKKANSKKFTGSKNWSITGRQYKKFTSDSHSRRKYDPGDVTLDVNGEKIIVTKLDGFYIRKEDAERIKELERDMLKKGISKGEIRAVVKRERRNAEKSLARQKKKVCFHCRKGGHNLSSCPKLNEGGAQIIGSGICYKCGSTEHSHFECRVTSGQSFKFATCFICKEEGHIARQCPDNPRGLYPDGGACKLCGDVTHFKKDCPSLPSKEKVTVGTIDRDIETLGDIEKDHPPKEFTQKKKNKIIKFK